MTNKHSPPIRIGETIELDIQKLTHNGEGLGLYEGFTIFSPQTFPGDEIKAKIISVKPNYGRALADSLIVESVDRVSSPCSVSKLCGGCQWQSFNYEAQLRAKGQILKDIFLKTTALSEHTLQQLIRPVLGMDTPFYYRNKAQFPFQVQDKKVVSGFFETRSHRVVPFDECLIQHPKINQVYQEVLKLVRKHQIPIYDEATQSGFLRHVLVRFGFNSQQLLLGFITRDMPFPHQRDMLEGLKKSIPGLVGIVQNINDKAGNTILGQQNRTLFGQDYLIDKLGEFQFKISLKAFYQINPTQTLKLYNVAREFAALTGHEKVLDAYAGTGSIAIWLAQQAQEVLGIEVVSEAVKDGKENCRLNGINNLFFVEGKVEKELPKVVRKQSFDCAILDPPRKGCQLDVLKTLAKQKIPTIVYVSCNPTTLARDANILMDKGYAIEAIQPVDMFPHTFHLETVVLFKYR